MFESQLLDDAESNRDTMSGQKCCVRERINKKLTKVDTWNRNSDVIMNLFGMLH